MIRYLHIRHLAIIDALALEFEPGFNVLTGETGAGKSIVVGAIELLLGGRASAEVVRTGSECATVESVLETIENKELILKREVSASGRSRAFVDGTLVAASTLRTLTGPLVDLHGQHDHQQLLDPALHLGLLDEFGGLQARVDAVGSAWDALALARQRQEALALDERERRARAELARVTLAEIERVGPRVGEDTELAAERATLANAERLTELAQGAFDALYDADGAALGQLAVVWRRLDELGRLDGTFSAHRGVRDTVQPVLDDLAMVLRTYVSSLERSPERLQQVEDRLASLERLTRKYGSTLNEVVAVATRARETLASMEATQDQRAEIERELQQAEHAYRSAAASLSADRVRAAGELGTLLQAEVARLAMEKARTEFRLATFPSVPDRWTRWGFDEGQLFIAANAGEELRPLARIASGGELSRVMLALKTLASTDGVGKTLIFDEVDAGIGGRVADTVGRRLRELGRRFQVICITHLPQVAAHATTHFRVSKHTDRGRTSVTVERLSADERTEELARLLAGRDVTHSARTVAAEMLAHAGESESPAEAKGESAARIRRESRL